MRLHVRKVVSRVAGPSHQGLRHDLVASFVVFLVAVPLSLGIAMASRAPLTAGLIAAAVGGIVAGAVGGSPLQVSGPAAGLTVVVAGLVDQFGWRTTCALTVAAGLVQIGLGVSRVARSVLAISPTVVHAMLAGIGLTIVLGQLHVLLGGQPGHSPLHNLVDLPSQLVDAHGPATILGLAVVALLLTWPRLAGPARALPGPLVAVVAATVVAEVWALEATRVDLPASALGAVQLPELPSGSWSAAVVAVLTLATVASVESLVSAVAVDKLHAQRAQTSRTRQRPTPGARGTRSARRTDFDRELIGQGAANALSGLLGGLPVTGVIVRSSANVLAGATGRASAVLHGVWVLLFSLLLAGLIERIPMAGLAGLLVVVGLHLVKPADVRTARAHGELPVYVVTATGVVAAGLLEGVAAGVALSLALMARRVLRTQVRVERVEPHARMPATQVTPTAVVTAATPATPTTPEVAAPATGVTHWRVVAEGTLSFLSVPRLSRLLSEIPAGSVVALHLLVDFLDHAVADHLRTWKHQHEAAGGTVLVDDIALLPRPTR